MSLFDNSLDDFDERDRFDSTKSDSSSTSMNKSFGAFDNVVNDSELYDELSDNEFNASGKKGSTINEFNSEAEKSKTKKYAIFCILLAVLIIILVAIVVRAISAKNKQKLAESSVVTQEIQVETQNVEEVLTETEKVPAQQAVENIIAEQQEAQTSTEEVVQNPVENETEAVLEAQVPVNNENKTVIINSGASEVKTNTNIVNDNSWLEFDKADNLLLADEYTALTYTVTEITHYARKVDINNNMELKTILKGSLSGFGGTYELDVPYSIGSNLKIGNSFKVSVRLGNYNGVSVVDEIAY